jgi:hypothetical protein
MNQIDIPTWKSNLKILTADIGKENAIGIINQGKLEWLERDIHEGAFNSRLSAIELPSSEAIVLVRYIGPACPMKVEMQKELVAERPFFIVLKREKKARIIDFGQHLLDAPLIGMPFIHGAYDCYSVIRRWYWQTYGILLAEIPRDPYWWTTDENYYVDFFGPVGFREIAKTSIADLRVGDGFICPMEPSMPESHGGIFIGDGRIIHHMEGHRSAIEPIGKWFDRATRIVRYFPD